jgi:hypothetical protein
MHPCDSHVTVTCVSHTATSITSPLFNKARSVIACTGRRQEQQDGNSRVMLLQHIMSDESLFQKKRTGKQTE